MRRNTSLLMCAWAMALVMGVAADAAHAGPDPPAGKYGIGVRANDGTWSEVPLGEPVVFPALGQLPNGDWVWGLEVHGWVNLPNPGGAGYQWAVRSVSNSFWEATDGYATATAPFVFGPYNWTGAVNGGHWSMWVTAAWGGPPVWGMGSGSYEVDFELVVNGPGIGNWFPKASCTAYMTW